MTSSQYHKINELLQSYSSLAAAFEAAEAEIKIIQLAAASELLPKHAELKVKLADLETQLRSLADAHYADLFPAEDEKRTHATPFGGLKYHKSSSLEAADEELSLAKIELACEREASRVRNLNEPPRFTADQLIRTRKELNLQALAELDDSTLALFAIRRIQKDNFKVVPFSMKSDKPKKQPKEQQAEAA